MVEHCVPHDEIICVFDEETVRHDQSHLSKQQDSVLEGMEVGDVFLMEPPSLRSFETREL